MKKILMLFLVLMLLPFASAELIVDKTTNEFSLSSNFLDKKVCSCQGLNVPVDVSNVGDLAAVFATSVDNEWFSALEDSFHLEPGQDRSNSIVGEVPCGFTGFEDFNVKVSSTYGREKHLHRNLEVVQCQNIFIEEGLTTDVVSPGEIAAFSFTLKNVAPFTETYKVSVNDYEDFVALSETSFELEAGEEMDVFVYGKFPVDMWGEFVIPLTVSAERNGLSQDLDLNLKIKRDYGFSVDVQTNIETCNLLETAVPVLVVNNGAVANVYTIDFKGPGFASIDKEEITLKPGEAENFFVTLVPGQRVGTGKAKLTFTSKLGDMVVEKVLDLNIDKCFDHSLTMDDKDLLVCGEKVYDVNVKNSGTQTEIFDLVLGGPAWAKLAQERVMLDPSENKNVKLYVDAPCADAEHEVKVTAVNANLPVAQTSDSMVLKVFTEESAHMVSLPLHNFDIGYNTKTVEVIVQGKGINEGVYEIDLDSLFLTLKEDVVRVAPGEDLVMVFVVEGLSEFEPGEYLHDLTFKLKGTNTMYDTTIGTNLKAPPVVIVFGKWLKTTFVDSKWYVKIGWCGWSGLILLFLAFIMAITAWMVDSEIIKTKRFKVAYRQNFHVLKGAIAVLVVLGVAFFVAGWNNYDASFYETPVETNDPFTFQWFENHEQRVGMSFEDPDSDNLLYAYKGADNMNVRFEDKEAVLTPHQDWSGENKVIFIAVDEAGEVAASPEMTLKVLARKKLEWFHYWLANCVQTNALIMAFIFLMLLVMVSKVSPRSKAYYQELRAQRKTKKTRKKKK